MNPQKPKINTQKKEILGEEISESKKGLNFPPTKKGNDLKKQYSKEKENIKYDTDQKLALETVGNIQAVISQMNEVGINKGEKSFIEEINPLIKNDLIFKDKKLKDIVENPELTQKLLNILENTKKLTKRQEELKNYLWPLNNFYKRSAKLLGKTKLDKKDFEIIKKEKKTFYIEFKESYTKWEKEKNKKENKKEEEKQTIKNYKENNEIKITNTNEYNYPINYETREITITEKGQTEKIKLTPEEISIINSNPETIENIVNFYKILHRLGLKKLWTIKKQLFKSIENVKGIGFRIDGDYLNKNEIKIFLNAILKSIGEKEIRMSFPIENFLGSIEILNKTQAISGNEAIVDTFNGETYLENKVFNEYVPRNSQIIGFNFSKFEENLK